MTKNNLLSVLGATVLVAAMSIGLIKSCQDEYNNSRPGVVYYVHGKQVIQRRFDTNEECQKYLNSEKGKQEAAYSLGLNNSKK